MKMKNVVYILMAIGIVISCSKNKRPKKNILQHPQQHLVQTPTLDTITNQSKPINEFGFDLDKFSVVKDTIRPGDSFGNILDQHGISRGEVHQISKSIKDTFNVSRIRAGKPYAVLKTKDTSHKAQVFIYQKNPVDYIVVDFRDTIIASKKHKPVTKIQKKAVGVISNSLSQAFKEYNLSPLLSYKLAEIYAWTIDFTRIDVGDRFKIIYTEKFIDDTLSVGIDEIKAAYFEHKGRPLYAFRFIEDPRRGIIDYYDQDANNLRRAFLRSPVKFSRITSRYNLRRRIKYYGNRIRPHRGTDFAAPKGTPILATADGVVTKSERRGGNGKYVRIRHNNTYETQYLHMRKQAVRVGQFVRQGEVIGYIGMTGNTSGPHVCYRFWKNGIEVDPFKQDLPASKPLADSLKQKFFSETEVYKIMLDSMKPNTQETLYSHHDTTLIQPSHYARLAKTAKSF